MMRYIGKISKKYYLREILACFLACWMLFGIPAQVAMANPTPGDSVIPGSGNVISTSPGTGLGWTGGGLNVGINSNAGNNIITWNNFDIGKDATLTFNQGSGWILNNVQDTMATGIWGKLNGPDCGLIVVNQQGVVFGPSALVNAKSFIASGLGIDEAQFLSGAVLDFEGSPLGPGVVELKSGAQINVQEALALIGKKVLNAGTISAPGGCVIMAAGNSILLGQNGSGIVVKIEEMTSVSSTADGMGDVINEGSIEADGGKVVLAAGDIYSIPLHPQLDASAVRVESGSGSVQQLGDIQADGAEGEVILTAGDEVVLGETSTTGEITSTTSSIGGKVITYAYDFGDKSATTYFNNGAEIAVGTGMAAINGNHILFDGTVDALPGATLQIDPVTLTIADGGIPTGGAAQDTFYEERVEFYSQAGINLDLAADELITVEYMTDDGEILGGSGNISLRNVFDTGGIYFDLKIPDDILSPRTAITTDDGGDIYMLAGSGGITAGDLSVLNDQTGDPGQILLYTSQGGDIDVDTLYVNSGNREVISVISGGDLTIDGGLTAIGHEVPDSVDKTVTADICLVAGDDVDITGPVTVETHGKVILISNIHIDAGVDPASNDEGESQAGIIDIDLQGGQIFAKAETSGPNPDGGDVYAQATIKIHTSATNTNDEKAINITNGKAGGSQAVQVRANVQGPINIDEKFEATDPTYFEDSQSDFDSQGNKRTAYALVDIQSNYNTSECPDCPKPPFLPPVPVIFWLVDDLFETNWRSGNIDGFDPEELDVLLNDNGIKFDAMIVVDSSTTEKGGTLELVLFNPGTPEEFYGFKYTPPTDQPFVWDGVSEYATFTDTFEYQATKEVDGETVISKNIATVEIVVTNFLPTANPDSQPLHMSTASNPTSASFDLSTLITDSDGSPGELSFVKGDNDAVFGTATVDSSASETDYVPFEGYVGGDDFDYTVTDDTIIYPETPVDATATLTINMENELPSGAVVLEDAHMNASGETLSVVSGDFTDADDDFAIANIIRATDDDNKTFGGTLAYNGSDDPYITGGTYDYTADGVLPGYVGEDDFDVQLWDGQYDYLKAIDLDDRQQYIDDGYVPFGGAESLIVRKPVYGAGTIDLTVTNTLPSGSVVLEDAHMNASGETLSVVSGDFTDDGPFSIVSIVKATDDDNKTFGGTLAYNGSDDPYITGGTYDYTADGALPGYVGEDDFDVQLWDGQKTYAFKEVDSVWVIDTENTTEVYGAGTIDVEVTNALPTASGNLGDTPEGTTLIVIQSGVSDPVSVEDLIDQGNPHFDNLSIVLDTYMGSAGGTLEFNGSEWIYTPASGHIGGEEFNVNVWDGQRTYVFDVITGEIISDNKSYATGTVTVTVTEAPPPTLLPAAPLPVFELPEIEGCPVLMEAVALELGVPEETIQVAIGNALAVNPNIQACDACARLVDSAAILRDIDGTRMAAMMQVFNVLAPADAPFTPEMAASIATAFADNINNAEMPQYATAMEYIDAFVQYIAVLDIEFDSPVGDSVAFVMEKYGTAINESDNPNISAYLAAQLTTLDD